MTIEQAIRPRNGKGQFLTVFSPQEFRERQKNHQATYLATHPWVKFYYYSKTRSNRLNREHTMTVADFKELWERDYAYLLKSPSVDRINPQYGYVKGNCRFIERSENSRLGNLGMNRIKVCPNCGWRNKPYDN